jgi:hypothetical protein
MSGDDTLSAIGKKENARGRGMVMFDPIALSFPRRKGS